MKVLRNSIRSRASPHLPPSPNRKASSRSWTGSPSRRRLMPRGKLADSTEYLEFAGELAREAGDVLKHYMDRERQVELKGQANLATVADKESEALIIRRILD